MNKELKRILSYGIHFDKPTNCWVRIEATKYDAETLEIVSWVVRKGNTAMSKHDGHFDFETMPSNRDEDYINEYRFSTVEEAEQCWNKFYNKL